LLDSSDRDVKASRNRAPSASLQTAFTLGYATRLLQRIHYNLSLDQGRGVVLG
jgi:hypothetical protein